MSTRPWTPGKGPMTRRLAETRLRELLLHAAHEHDGTFLEVARRTIPEAWLTLELDVDVAEPKEKMTLYLDKSVARFLRSMGTGYQARINRILRTWVQAKISGHIDLEVDMLRAIEQASAEAHSPTVPPSTAGARMALHEHWAYVQGVMDATSGPAAVAN